MTPPDAWLATFTRRWHCNPDLGHTTDPVGWHGARMAILALHLWPYSSRNLIMACLTHDLGESVTGDIPWPAKQASPYLKQELDQMEAEALAGMGMKFETRPPDTARLKYLDRLDAYLWMMHHKPKLRKRKDWKEARKWLDEEKAALCSITHQTGRGCERPVTER